MRVLSRLIPLCLSLSYLTKIGDVRTIKNARLYFSPEPMGIRWGGVPLIFWMFRLTFGTEWHTELHLCVTWERCLCSLSHIGVGRGKVGIFDKNKPQQVQRVGRGGERNKFWYLSFLALSWKVKYMHWWHHRFIYNEHYITALISGWEWAWLYASFVLEV